MAMVTVMRKEEGGRLQPRPQHLGPGCPQARGLWTLLQLRSEIDPSLPGECHTGLWLAGAHCTLKLPQFTASSGLTRGWILTQLLTISVAPEAKRQRRRPKTKATSFHRGEPSRVFLL